MPYVGRLAPSPTGPLHLGNARTFLLAWLDARAHGGRLILRMEDIDTPRTVPGAAEEQLRDLRWLGLDWDEGPDMPGPSGPCVQSLCTPRYEAALQRLEADGRLFACTCSRKDLQRAASAPHAGEEGSPYPGTCRGRFANAAAAREHSGRAPALRFRVDAGQVAFADRVLGRVEQDVAAAVGDVVLRRADGLYAYQLAVTVDDAAMGVTHVVRAADLCSSTPRQLLLFRALGAPAPAYAHVPLLNTPDGSRLQKREPRHTLTGLRAAGVDPRRVVGWLAHSVGVQPVSRPASAAQLVQGFGMHRVREGTDWSCVPG